MSGVVLYSPEEARRNTFSVTKFHTLLGAALPALGIAPADMEQALRASVRPQFVEMNLAALRLGAQAQKKADEKGETDHD